MAGVEADEGGEESSGCSREVEDVVGEGLGFSEDFGWWVAGGSAG